MRYTIKENLIARTRRVSTSVRKVSGSLTKPSRDVSKQRNFSECCVCCYRWDNHCGDFKVFGD